MIAIEQFIHLLARDIIGVFGAGPDTGQNLTAHAFNCVGIKPGELHRLFQQRDGSILIFGQKAR